MTTRRDILLRFAAVAGTAGAYQAMVALGLAEGDQAWGGMPKLPPASGKGIKVVILGAGVAGLSAAWELGKAGYECTILEARDRTGGRNWSVRKGSVVELTDGSKQVCEFDEGYYFNVGPARLPSHHDATLGYVREFGIEMETEVNYTGSALIQSDRLNGGKAVTMRQAVYSYRGKIAELLAKCTKAGGLDATFTPEDRDKLIAGLGVWGGLVKDLTYQGSESGGYVTPPGEFGVTTQALPATDFATVSDPYMLKMSTFHDIADMQATMLQPVGGMDRIPAAFEARLSSVIKKGCEVKSIRRKGKGAEITYLEKDTGKTASVKADYCICTIGLAVLDSIDNDFSPARKAAIKSGSAYGDGYKIGFQSPRFWETNDQIYGGLSFSERDTNLTWYPSAGFFKPEGILVAGYAGGPLATKMGARSLAEQIDYAKGTVDRLHPGQSGKLKTPISVHWGKVPYSLGLVGRIASTDPKAYDLLNTAEGPFYFAGDYLAHVGAWQQGAFVSAHRVVNMIAERQKSLKS
jgi:monoamine oxidase